MQPVDWASIDDAVFCWAVEKLGMAGVWENQNIPQPDYPYLSFLRGGETDDGGIDEIRQRTLDANGNEIPPGSSAVPVENEEITYQPITFPITIQAHVNFESGATEPFGEAKRRLGILKRSVYQTTTTQLFSDAGLGVVSVEPVVDLSLVVNGEWLSRAALDVIFRTASIVSERVGFIEKVELKSEQLGIDTIVDAS
jgi:hypothetical protein